MKCSPILAEKRKKMRQRAIELVAAAEIVNMNQFSHGINSAKSKIKSCLRQLGDTPPEEWEVDGPYQRLYDYTLTLAGYLFWLRMENR